MSAFNRERSGRMRFSSEDWMNEGKPHGQRAYRYSWEATYVAALDEVDKTLLPARIDAARAAIEQRWQQLGAVQSPSREHQALRDAIFYLNLLKEGLKNERLFPSSSTDANYPHRR